MPSFESLAVIGAGAWGTALATVQAKRGAFPVKIWAREKEVAASINTSNENKSFLPNVPLPDGLTATSELSEAATAALLLLVVPAQFSRSVIEELASLVHPSSPVVLCSKGIETKTLTLMSGIVEQAMPGHPYAVLSGPSFAAEVAKGLPTALTLACKDQSLGRELSSGLASPLFRLYYTDDVVGAQIGGAVKNVLAIACGIVDGKQLGENARAAIVARGFMELERFAVACGGRPETVAGLSGLGDLILTCTSHQSRNMSLGASLGAGEELKQILSMRSSVAEGVKTAEAVGQMAEKMGIDMPICAAVNEIVSGRTDIDTAINDLLSRPLTDER